MLKNGDIVYFIINGHIMNSHVIDLKEVKDGYIFSIDGYAACEGNHIISSTQIHHTVFLTEDEAILHKDNPQMYLSSHC